jgi:hypothetical protein
MDERRVTSQIVVELARIAGLPQESLADPQLLADRLEMILRLVEEASVSLGVEKAEASPHEQADA